MEIFDFENEYVAIRKYAKEFSLKNILENRIPEIFIKELKRVLYILRDKCSLLINVHLQCLVSEDIKIEGINDTWSSIRLFTSTNYSNQYYLEYFMFELLLYIYNPIPEFIHIEKNIVKSIKGISINDEGLIDAKSPDYICKKEGVLFGDYLLFYNKYLPGAYLSHGFLSDLLDVSNRLSDRVSFLGFALDFDIMLNKKYYRESITKAYIRGPIGLSEKVLNNESFPEDNSGTVTEHKRIEIDPLLDNTCPLDRLEIMWSYRDSLKTVQIEELKPEYDDNRDISCRYLHSQWDTFTSRIVHFDGAIRTYSKANYHLRFNTDLKKDKGKADGYVKLFKINASLELRQWCVLATKYYDPNELIVEYFGGYAIEK